MTIDTAPFPDAAPLSARRVSVSFKAYPQSDGWAISRMTTWKDRNGDWDGDFTRIASGLGEDTARAEADRLNAR